MKKTLIAVAVALFLAGCSSEFWDAADAVLEALEPTDQDVCESELIGGQWIDGKCWRLEEIKSPK